MKVERIDYVAIRVRDIEKASKFFGDLLEQEFNKPVVDEGLDVRVRISPLGIEVAEPLTPDGAVAKVLDSEGEGITTLMLKVPNIEEAMAEMESRGIRLVTTDTTLTSKVRVAFYHPKDTYGVMLGLIEYKPSHHWTEFV